MNNKLVEKYRGISPVAKSSMWFTICNFLQRGTAFITVPIFTRLLTTQEYGICNIYFAWFEVFLLCTSLKIPYEGLNNGLIRYEKDKDGYVASILGLITLMTVLTFGLYLVFHGKINYVIGLDTWLMILMFIHLLFNVPLNLWINRERFDFRYKWPVIVTIISTILNVVISIFAVLHTNQKAEARIISLMMLQVFWGAIFSLVIFYRGKKFFDKKYWKFSLGFNLPLIFYYISQVILNHSDRIMINFFSGSGSAAIYSVAYSAATIILVLVSAINGSYNPWMYKKLKAGDFDQIKKMSTLLCGGVAMATMTMSILAPDVIRIMATEEYNQAIWIIPSVSASVFFIFLYMLFANVEMYYEKNKGISCVSIIASITNLMLNWLLIPVFGYMVAGWTTLISYMLLAYLHYRLYRSACVDSGKSGAIFDIKKIVIISAMVCVFTLVSLFLYTTPFIRYIVLGIDILGVVLLKSKIRINELNCDVKKKGTGDN